MSLPEDHSLFLANMDNKEKPKPISPVTVANIVKQALSDAGVDTEVFNPHSIRSAASIAAPLAGNKVTEVKKHANWSLLSSTFEDHYFKPYNGEHAGVQIMNSIFSPTEKSTTSESEGESTGIVLGTTHNTTVDEA